MHNFKQEEGGLDIPKVSAPLNRKFPRKKEGLHDVVVIVLTPLIVLHGKPASLLVYSSTAIKAVLPSIR